jgi:hypothetical protein
MNKKEKEFIKEVIENEGFDYAFTQYSSFDEIEDSEFHKLINQYVEAQRKLKNYIFNN